MNNEKHNPQMDWQQVVINGGPPCFFIEGARFCGCAERWAGHGVLHDFVSLTDYVVAVREEAREEGFREANRATCSRGAKIGESLGAQP